MTTTRAPHSPAAKRRTQRLARALAGAAASVLSTVGVALAEDSASEDVWAGIEEMVVIGSSATALLQEVSVSVASFDSADLEAIGAQSIADVAQFTPNLEIRTVFAASNPTLFIRGVGLRDFNANSASSVAVYNDDVYMNSPAAQLAQLFDTERVDILRGPQGTLFGRNASAGAIRIVSRRPTGGFGGFTRFTYGRYDQIEVEGAIEAPIVPGKLSIRLAGRRNLRDGITENRCGDSEFWDDPGENARTSFKQRVHNSCFNDDTTSTVGRGQGWVPGEPTGVDEDVNDKDNWAARAILHFEPTVDQDWFLNVHGGQNRGDSRQFQVIGVVDLAGGFDLGRPTRPIYRDPDTETPNTTFPPIPPIFGAETPEAGDAFAGDYNTVGKEELDLLGGNLRGEIQWGDLTFTTITGIEWNQRNVETNLDGGPRISLEPELDNHSYQFTQELTATYDTGGEYTLEAGTTFLFEHLEVENRIDLDPNRFTLQDYEQDTYYGALFAYGSWAPSADLLLEGGVRWNLEARDFDLTTVLTDVTSGNIADPESATESFTDDAFTGEVKLNYKPTEDILFYAKYSRGWKSPHINGGVVNPGQTGSTEQNLVDPIDPEEVDALEFGVKAELFQSRVRLNSAAFYYDYQNIQVFQLRNSVGGVPVNELINASDADVYGIELETTLLPLDGWAPVALEGLEIFLSVAWLTSEYTDFVTTRVDSLGTTQITTVLDYSGNNLINSPELSFAGYVQYPLVLGRFGTLTPRWDWSFKDDVYFSPENNEAIGQNALWLMNLRLGYTIPGDGLEIAGWVRNLTDQTYRVDVFNLSRFRNSILYAIGDPRTYGITLSVRF
ncbi:MAG: TonB-dependent receptor [Deltaproteobacteria bacterium]|jgi:iron complex outermembrane receptor protein|nr:TonB-dependent receptor [Deltaproteobacteria bacterium]